MFYCSTPYRGNAELGAVSRAILLHNFSARGDGSFVSLTTFWKALLVRVPSWSNNTFLAQAFCSVFRRDPAFSAFHINIRSVRRTTWWSNMKSNATKGQGHLISPRRIHGWRMQTAQTGEMDGFHLIWGLDPIQRKESCVTYRMTHLVGENPPLTKIWEVWPSCLGSR